MVHPLAWAKWLLLLCVALLLSFAAAAQDDEGGDEEILVSLVVSGIGNVEMPAVISKDSLYLPIADVFNYLVIKNTPSESLNSVSGFFIEEAATYVIDKTTNTIKFGNTVIPLQPDDLVRTETGLYLKLRYFGEVFGLKSTFNFRALLVTMVSTKELPAIREARMSAMRRNASKLQGLQPAELELPRKRPFLYFGNMDWAINSTQQTGGGGDNRVAVGLGGILAGGEMNVLLNYSNTIPFEGKNQFYLWRHVDNDNKALTQVSLGKIMFRPTASLFAPVIGGQITNTPTTARKAFGSYVISNITEPNWVVELYVNGSLIDYTRADATGFYSFNVPLMYGNSNIKLAFYGPFGEQRLREETVTIPFNLLPKNKLEYVVSGGIVEDDSAGKIMRGALGYGISNKLTIGGGLEYLSTVSSTPIMPFANASARVTDNFLLFAEYAHGVRSKGVLTYRFPHNWQFEATYIKYASNQEAIINSRALEERKAVLSTPFRRKWFNLFSLMTLNQLVLPNASYTTAEWMLSSMVKKVDVRLTTYGMILSNVKPAVYTNLSLGFRMPYKILFSPQMQYEYSKSEIISVRGVVEKYFSTTSVLSVLVERNMKSNYYNASLQFRYDLPFAQFNVTTRLANNSWAVLESARGGIVFDPETRTTHFNNRMNVSRGAVVVMPYLDINCNNVHDKGEPRVWGIKLNTNMGEVMPQSKDSCIRIYNLEPYTKIFIELDKYSFDNIAWQIKKHTIRATVEPNMHRPIEVPISVVAEVSGTVTLLKNDREKGQGQISVCIYQNDMLVQKVLSEPDGYFSYMGLAPGDYVVAVDSGQMRRLKMKASKPITLTINPNEDGDVVTDVNFLIQPLAAKTEEEEK
jgi:hypothetical protein